LHVSLASELAVLAHALHRLSHRDRHSRDFTLGALTDVLGEVIACFPVYRTYVDERTESLDPHDRSAVQRALRVARRKNPTMDKSIFAYLGSVFMLEGPSTAPDDARKDLRNLLMKVQQLTGPVMAKGVEDTAFYVYNRLVSLNEVGGEPERFGRSVAELHRANAERQASWPASLLAGSTHDTKRSEDVRARIGVLSELPGAWGETLAALAERSARYRTDLEGGPAPDHNEEYLFYQTLVGTWPAASLQAAAPGDDPGAPPPADYCERLVAYMRKATKEAKVNTSWVLDDPEYDRAVESFVRGVLSAEARVGEVLLALARLCWFHGMWSSLSQLLLRLTAPGVPDIYQGTEIWDDSLVDPDNRRPVDHASRRAMLAEVRRRAGDATLLPELVQGAADGRIKLFVIHAALAARRRWPKLFAEGSEYVALESSGEKAEHVVAFARRAAGRELVVLVPRLTARLAGGRAEPPTSGGPGENVWGDTSVAIGAIGATGAAQLTDVFGGGRVTAGASGLRVADALASFPVALLERQLP
jgi:(1->4)-alpha-D-glucan 1-alpha-D-glucosylmutase